MADPSKTLISKLSLFIEEFIPSGYPEVTPVAPEHERPEAPLAREAREGRLLTDGITLDVEPEEFHFGQTETGPAKELLAAAWNVERNLAWQAQVDFLTGHPLLSQVNLWLFSELDRGCTRSGYRHCPRELARLLNMNGVFSVKYVELPREHRRAEHQIHTPGEHGQAILTRFPILASGEIRHRFTEDMSTREDQPRLGGGVTLWADIDLGGEVIRAYCAHLDAGLGSDPYRVAQVKEIVAHALDSPHPVIVGGDLNAMWHTLQVWTGLKVDPVTRPFLEAGFADAHARVPARRRATTRPIFGVPFSIDLLYTLGLPAPSHAEVPRFEGYLSDHYPVAARFPLAESVRQSAYHGRTARRAT